MDPNPNPSPTTDPAPADAPSRSGPEPDPVPEQAPLEPAVASDEVPQADSPKQDVNQAGPTDSPKEHTPAAHINPPAEEPKEPEPMESAARLERAPSSEASAEAPHSPDPSVPAPAPAEPAAPSTRPDPVTPPVSVPAPQAPAVPPVFTTHLPLTMVQTTGDDGQILTARQLGQRARRARERELQAQGLYTPKRRTSSSATLPDLSHAQPQAQSISADVTMQSADEGGDDDGEGELESEVTSGTTSTPSVPPHSASHLIPPIAVLAPVTTPSRASLAQRARRDRERATRLGLSPTSSPNGHAESPPTPAPAPTPVQVGQPIPFNPQAGQTPPTLTRGQLAQRARRARERVERAAKQASANGAHPGENWTPSLNSTTDGSGGMSSAGEAVFAVAPPPPGFSTGQMSQTSPQAGYGVGLGAAHVPQQLNRAQLAQRARRARERQQRLSQAATHASGVYPTSPSAKPHPRSESGSVPPASPTAARQNLDASPARTSMSPMTSSTTDAPAPLKLDAQFNQVFQSLTAGDNGVSRAIADSGAGVLTSGARTSSPAERATSAPVSKAESVPKVDEPMEVDPVDDNVDELEEAAPTPVPAPAPAPTTTSTLRAPTPPIQTPSPGPQPEVNRPVHVGA